MQLNKAIETRQSIRKFGSKKPDWRKILEAIDAAGHAPSAGGIYSLKFIVVDNAEKISQLAKAAQQNFISEAKYVVVACSPTKLTLNSYGSRGKRYLRQQAGAGIENFLLSLNEKKIDTCWVGHFADSQVKRILEIPEDVNVEALFPVGLKFKKEKLSKKPSLNSILYFNKYGNKKMKNAKKID